MKLRISCLLLYIIIFLPELVFCQTNKLWIGRSDDITSPRWAVSSDFDDGGFVFCRGYYSQNRFEAEVRGWYVDYPGADYNFLIRFSELTEVRISRDLGGKPVHVVVHLDSPLLFRCPILFLSDVSTIGLDILEINNLRKYLEKGGFIWADDFWGSAGLDHWENQIKKVLPSDQYPIINIPQNHIIMHQLYSVDKIPQISNYSFWYEAGKTSERGEDSKDVHFRGIEDKKGRLIVVATHNTDIGETWERESLEQFYLKFSPVGYAIGINIFLYALTH